MEEWLELDREAGRLQRSMDQMSVIRLAQSQSVHNLVQRIQLVEAAVHASLAPVVLTVDDYGMRPKSRKSAIHGKPKPVIRPMNHRQVCYCSSWSDSRAACYEGARGLFDLSWSEFWFLLAEVRKFDDNGFGIAFGIRSGLGDAYPVAICAVTARLPAFA